MSKGLVKLYGIERTGTNYVKCLLERNLHVHVFANLFGLKHEAFVPGKEFDGPVFRNGSVVTDISTADVEDLRRRAQQEGLKYLVLIKDPYAWVVSYHRYMNQITHQSGRLLNDQLIDEYCTRWNNTYSNWCAHLVQDDVRPTLVLQYERILEDFAREIERVRCVFDLETQVGVPVDITNSTHMGGDWTTESGRNISGHEFGRREYYLSRDYLDDLSEKEIRRVEDVIDLNLYRKLHEAATY